MAASSPGQRELVSQELLLTTCLLPSQWQAPSLSQSLSWASNREDSLPKTERTQFGFSLRPWGCMNPLPKLNLTANGSQDFAGFPPQGKPSMALNLEVNPSHASHFSILNQACVPPKHTTDLLHQSDCPVTLLNIAPPWISSTSLHSLRTRSGNYYRSETLCSKI